jgi:dethiobiotin synthetase
MAKQFFITGTGTEIGKSFYLQKLCQKYRDDGLNFHAIKPIISGFDINDKKNDSSLILKSLELENSLDNLNNISPWRFTEPISPNIAAQIEGKKIDFNEVVKFCKNKADLAKKSNVNFFIEGAGGIMTPINNKCTYLDLMERLKIPVILVTGNYLGTISHTLTALKCLESRNVEIAKIIFNSKEHDLDTQQTLVNLSNFTKIPIELIS